MTAVERELLLLAGPFEDLEELVRTRPAFLEGNVEQVEFEVEPARADAELQAVVRERLKGQYELRERQRMPAGTSTFGEKAMFSVRPAMNESSVNRS